MTNWSLKRLMTEVVGSGPRSAEDMTYEQSASAFRQLLDGSPDPTTVGAFLLANRWKRNTPEELAGFIDVMVEESVERVCPSNTVIDCGANYDGKQRTALLGVAAGLVTAAAGTPVVVHSGNKVPTQRACAYKHVLDELEVQTGLDATASAELTEATGFGFYYQPAFNPGIHGLLDRREQMGVRTVINTIETLANPAGAPVHVGSFYHLAFAKKMIGAIELSRHADFDRALLFQGLEGYDDVRPGYTKVAEWDGEELTSWKIESGALNVAFDSEDLEVDDVASDSAEITRDVLGGRKDGPFADAIVLNAALRLYAAGEVDDIEKGIDRARSAIADGSAADRLEAVQAWTPPIDP